MKVIHYIGISVLFFSGQLHAQDNVAPEINDIEIKTLEWPDGTRYEGGVLNGKKEGQGVIYWADGTRFEGVFAKL